ncbi:manganese efflux pump MntP family protein [Paenibacillaceae bacterium WGS1546]|uniref:manganese efflux pump MntP n=1 Tax=Cohnella sp. WGS1546 TaxID=3366810 RepID=UPI00372D15FB
METLFAWMITMSLGLDTLIISTSLGMQKQPRDKVKIALVFAAAESVMPIVGILIGSALSHYFQSAASVIGSLLLIGVGIYFLVFDDDEKEKKSLNRELAGWTLVATALSLSLDELAVGFTAGFIQVPIVLTVMLIASRTFVFTFIGAAFGAKLKPYLGEWAEKAPGVLLGLMGVWMLLETVFEL